MKMMSLGVKMGMRAFSTSGFSKTVPQQKSRSMEALNNNEYLEQISLDSMSLHCSSTSISKTSIEGEAYILDSTIKSKSNQYLPNLQETINDTLMEKLNIMSFAEERILLAIIINKDENGSLGLHITEGSDGNVYVQSVIVRGPANCNKRINKGDQVIAVNGLSLLGRTYHESIDVLKNTGKKVEVVISRIVTTSTNQNSGYPKDSLSDFIEDNIKFGDFPLPELIDPDSNNVTSSRTSLKISSTIGSQIENHSIESCHELSNIDNCVNRSSLKEDVSYHPQDHSQKYSTIENRPLVTSQEYFYKGMSGVLSKLPNDNDKAVIVDLIPKRLDRPVFQLNNGTSREQNSLFLDEFKETKLLDHASGILLSEMDKKTIQYNKREQLIALPRSLGLGRKWKGPVRYPVTPIRKTNEDEVAGTLEEEQVFI